MSRCRSLSARLDLQARNPFHPPRIDRMVQVVDFFCLSIAYFCLTSISCHIGLYTAELQCNSLCILQVGLTPSCILRTAQAIAFSAAVIQRTDFTHK